MKYIKLFESYESYMVITEDDFNNRSYRFIEIPISIYSEISKSINKVSNRIYKKEKLIHKAYDDRNIILNSIEFIGIINMLKSDPYDKWWIHMDDDDWFWITILGVSGVTVEYSEYYKCDSKSGLYELLKYKNVIN